MKLKHNLIKTIISVIILLSTNFSYGQSSDTDFGLINRTPQHSLSWSHRPANVSKGIVGRQSKTQVVISGVPSYLWRYGCGPTALGMVMGYYDIMGFSDIFTGSAATQTADVNNGIANSQHYSDYSEPIDYYPDLYQDKSELGGAHTSNCIADYMHTSWSLDDNRYGWSYSSRIGSAFTQYAQQQNSSYTTSTSYEYFNSGSWDIYKNEIDNNHPVVLLVDSDGDGYTDHFVTGIGYDDSNYMYAIYDTWDNDIHWYAWREISSSYSWGIYGFNILHFTNSIAVTDLEPYRPHINYNWSDNIVVKNTTVTTGQQDMQDDYIVYGDDIYVAFSYWNNSSNDITDDFNIKIYIDGNENFYVTQNQTLQGYYYWMWWNYPVNNTLSVGTHTIKMVIDEENQIPETDETNNEYSRTFTVHQSANISNLNNSDFYITPNPVNDKIILPVNFSNDNTKIKIYTLSGQCVKSEELSSNEINTNDLKTGVYFIKIITPNSTINRKFIKN